MLEKVYVDVLARFCKDGSIIPIKIIWQGKTVYNVDQIIDVSPSFAAVGGKALRYICRIGMNKTEVFLEGNRWFVQARQE